MSATSVASADAVTPNISHMPQDGDRLHPNVAFSINAITRVDTLKKYVKFSPSDFFELDDCDAMVYVDADTISFIQFSSKHSFTMSEGMLWYKGYENRASDFRFSTPIPVAAINGSTESFEMQTDWNAKMSLYGMELLKKAEGISTSKVQRGWTLVSDTDSIKNATYITWDMEMSYFDADSINPELPDSINTEIVSEMQLRVSELARERVLSRQELWYSEAARYPVLLRSRNLRLIENETGVRDTIPLSYYASYYPARLQYEDFGEEGAFPISPHHLPGNTSSEARDHPAQDGVDISDPIHDGERISLILSSKDGVMTMYLTLYSVSGMRLSETMEVAVGAIPQTAEIPVPADVNGIVILLIESDTESTFRKIIL